MVAARIATMPQGRPSGKAANLPVSQEEAATLMGVSERTVRTAKAVQEQAEPEVVALVRAYPVPAPQNSCPTGHISRAEC